MTNPILKIAALSLAVPGLALAAPAASAAPVVTYSVSHSSTYAPAQIEVTSEYDRGRKRGWQRGRGNPHRYTGGYGHPDRYYGEPVYRSTRVWRGRDGEYYCRKKDGTTGLLIGGAAGALLGREIAGRNGDRTLGAILGAAGGALLGREIDRGGSRCR